ncbi:hypothetical protein PG993_003727 [Apiospora rasikravindrae]|uniref:Uncharacterized protein n=1 Tax=Apiospora rasikravindrae TaxID=990691 RepID=A0ABR1U0W1_9PEZI
MDPSYSANHILLEPIRAPTENRKGTATRSHNWAPEISALLCSSAALIALIILLAQEDQKPLDDWKAPFSLNTVAAILSVVFRTPLAFAVGSCLGQGKWSWFSKRSGPVAVFAAIDEASRGPLGSLGLLWRLKARHWVSFGALTTVALVAVDPFLQAIINYEGQLALENNTDVAFIGRASHLDIGTQEFFSVISPAYHGEPGIAGCYGTKANVGMSTSSILGFVNSSASNSAKPPLVTCQTGNCTWEAYSTLAFCSACFDVSAHLKKQREPDGVPDCGGVYGVERASLTNYTIPYGPAEAYYWGKDGKGDGRRSTHCGNSTVAGRTLVQPKDTYNLQEWDTLLVAFVLLHPSEGYFKKEIPWENDVVSATECGLRLCTKVFQPNVTNGETHETLLSDAFERVPESFQPTNHQAADNATVKQWIKYDFGSSLYSRVFNSTCAIMGRDDLQLRIPDSATAPNDIQRTFSITQASITTIVDEIVSDGSQRIFDALNESTSLATSFENAARLMSYQIRELDGTRLPGSAQKWTIYIQIRWQFMIFPIVTSILGSIFSVTVMLGSRRSKTRIMKANMLESMLHGLDEETSTQLRNSNVKDKMEKHVFVKLRDGPEGLRLQPPDADYHASSDTLRVLQPGSSNPSFQQSWHAPG